jgi:iron complex outermembrane receptor protein
MISKRPTETPQHEVLFQTGSFNRLEGAIDTSGPIDSNGQWLYRFVGLGRLADTQIENVEDNQYYVAPSLTWRPNLDTSFTILASAQSYGGRGYQQYVPAQGSLLPNPNGRIPYSRNLGEPGFDRILLDQRQIGYALEHRFNDILQFRQNVRYTDISLKGQALREEGLLPDLRTVPRSALFLFGNVNSIAIDNHFQADFATGPFSHKVLLGMDYMRTKSDSGFNVAAGTPLDIFAPVYGAAQPNFNAAMPLVHSRTDLQQLGFYAQDQVKYGGWILSLTGRADHAVNTTSDLLGRTTSDQTDTATTGRAGLGYLFDNGIAPYVSYSTSFEPTVGLDAQRNPFKPTTGQSTEIGVKYQPTWFKGLFTAALFDTTRQNVLTTDLGNPLLSIQTGEVNVKGFELEARASLTDRLEIIGGYSRIVPRVTESNTGNVGKIMPNISLETASAWAMYTMHDGPLAGWGIGAGVRHVGKSYANDQNTLTVTPYTLFDATVTYDFAYLRPDLRGLKLQVSVTNLADTYYVANCFDLTYCGLGSGRTVLASLKYQWGAGANTAAAPVRPVASLN